MLCVNSSDWDLVVSFFRACDAGKVAAKWERSIRAKADGFGRLDYFSNAPEFWDWSHVRDSSDEAIAKMATKIRRIAGFLAA